MYIIGMLTTELAQADGAVPRDEDDEQPDRAGDVHGAHTEDGAGGRAGARVPCRAEPEFRVCGVACAPGAVGDVSGPAGE